MGTGTGKQVCRAGMAFVILAVISCGLASTGVSADYPRRVAIAPFVSLSQDDIASTVAVLPRLLSSRLMAHAGAEVVLLPADVNDPLTAARAAQLPLLIQGTVAKLGKGYSIDVTAKDLETGKTAGAFFAAASTEDEIIPQIGFLAGDVAEKLFGVKQAPRYIQAPVALPASGGAGVAQAQYPVAVAAPAQAPAVSPATIQEGWVPSSMKKVSESDKIADELYGVATIDAGPEGNGEVVAYGKRTLYFYRLTGKELAPAGRITKDRQHHILNVDVVDVDGDGKKEIVVASLEGEKPKSFVLKRKGDVYEEIAGGIPYYLVVLPDWMGKRVVVGQEQGVGTPFFGKFLLMSWDGVTFKAGEPLSANTSILPLSAGIFGLSSAKFGGEWRLIYTDAEERLRLVDSQGKSQYKSKEKYGMAPDYFEFGLLQPLEGKRMQLPLRKAARTVPGPDERPFVLITVAKKGVMGIGLGVSIEASRLVLLQWDGSEFTEKAETPKSDRFRTGADFLFPSGLRKGGRVVVSSIEQVGSAFEKEVSRLLLFEVE